MGLLKRTLSSIITFNLLILPLLVFSETNILAYNAELSMDDFVKGKMEGMIKGSNSGDRYWFFSGFLLSVIGLILPCAIDPSVPNNDLIGKPSSYVLRLY